MLPLQPSSSLLTLAFGYSSLISEPDEGRHPLLIFPVSISPDKFQTSDSRQECRSLMALCYAIRAFKRSPGEDRQNSPQLPVGGKITEKQFPFFRFRSSHPLAIRVEENFPGRSLASHCMAYCHPRGCH